MASAVRPCFIDRHDTVIRLPIEEEPGALPSAGPGNDGARHYSGRELGEEFGTRQQLARLAIDPAVGEAAMETACHPGRTAGGTQQDESLGERNAVRPFLERSAQKDAAQRVTYGSIWPSV